MGPKLWFILTYQDQADSDKRALCPSHQQNPAHQLSHKSSLWLRWGDGRHTQRWLSANSAKNTSSWLCVDVVRRQKVHLSPQTGSGDAGSWKKQMLPFLQTTAPRHLLGSSPWHPEAEVAHASSQAPNPPRQQVQNQDRYLASSVFSPSFLRGRGCVSQSFPRPPHPNSSLRERQRKTCMGGV